MISIVIIHAQEMDRKTLANHLSSKGDINILGFGKDGYDALKIVGSLNPDIALISSQLDYIEGQEIPPLLKLRSPRTSVILLADNVNDKQLLRAVINDVAGFVCRKTDFNFLPEIIKWVAGGGRYISPGLSAKILKIISSSNRNPQQKIREARFPAADDPVSFLSKKELQIISRLGEGYSSSEIASELKLSAGTVKNNISTLIHKTGLENRLQIVLYAINHGLIPAMHENFP